MRHLLPDLGLALPVGRAVRHDQELGTGLEQALRHLLEPDVLADRQAETEAAKPDRPRQRPDLEHAELVEDAVVGELDLVAEALHLAVVEERDGIVDLAALRPRRADDHARPAVGGILGEGLDRRAARVLERRLEDEILRRIAGDEQLGEDEKVGAVGRGLRPRRARLLQVALDVADDRVELGDGEADGVGDRSHGGGV